MEVAYVPSIHPLWTLCLLTELGSQRLISVGEENIRDSLFREEGKAAHLSLTVKGKSLSARSLLPRTTYCAFRNYSDSITFFTFYYVATLC